MSTNQNQARPCPWASVFPGCLVHFQTENLEFSGSQWILGLQASGRRGATQVNSVEVRGFGGLHLRLSAPGLQTSLPGGRFPFVAIQRCSKGGGESEDMRRERGSAL